MKNSNLAVGILGGLAVGTVLGILFAPAKGSETRKKIADKGTDLKDKVVETTGKFSDKISQTVQDLKRESQELLGHTKEIMKEEVQNFDHLAAINKQK